MALQIFMQQGIEDGVADVYNGLAGFYYKAGNIDSIGYFARKAYEIYEISGNKEMMSFMSINIAGLYNMQKKHKEALEFIQKGISIARELGMLSQLRQGYKAMSETYAYLGDYQKAYENYELYTVFKDSVFNIDKARAFDELMTHYQTEKKSACWNKVKTKWHCKTSGLNATGCSAICLSGFLLWLPLFWPCLPGVFLKKDEQHACSTGKMIS
jgi:tetratricopeptide (TPR) repeat protein